MGQSGGCRAEVGAANPRHMKKILMLSVLLVSTPLMAQNAAESWLQHVRILGDDNMEGRLAGTPGYDRAAAYVANRFQAIGLKPAGTDGFLQPVGLTEQTVSFAKSSLTLGDTPLKLGDQILPAARVQQYQGAFDAPLVFIGYGLPLADQGHDDFAGLDLKGKIVVTLAGGPKTISAGLRSHARNTDFWTALQNAGAIGVISIANPNFMDIPWDRVRLQGETPGMRLSDAQLNDAKQPFFTASFKPEEAELLFARSDYRFADLVKLANVSAELPRFALNQNLKGKISSTDRQFSSPNVVGKLQGKDPRLSAEYVVITGHLDHLGVGQAIKGDTVYNGVMDNSTGIASIIETAGRLAKSPPKRSILFVAVTAEERGLLGSRYFAARPTVPADAIIANLNVDMYLPLWPLKHLTALGAEESTLGRISAGVAKSLGVKQVPDSQPERNLFVRSDQYSFVRQGVPALALKFAAVKPEEKAIEKAWLTDRYHAPQDDLSQPINPEYALQFNRFLEKLSRTVANAEQRPAWYPESFFKRFSK